jgi:hypothetical protein
MLVLVNTLFAILFNPAAAGRSRTLLFSKEKGKVTNTDNINFVLQGMSSNNEL